jgi:hypothetical protein
MKTLLTRIMILAGLAASSCLAQDTNSTATTPDISRLTNGMAFAQFEATLGVTGDILPQTAEFEPHYIFDFDGMFICAEVRTTPGPSVVKRFTVTKDNMTAQQRRKQRFDSISRAVVRRQRIGTNAVPNRVPVTD